MRHVLPTPSCVDELISLGSATGLFSKYASFIMNMGSCCVPKQPLGELREGVTSLGARRNTLRQVARAPPGLVARPRLKKRIRRAKQRNRSEVWPLETSRRNHGC